MSIQRKIAVFGVLLVLSVLCSAAALLAQARGAASRGSVLQQHYEAAEKYQSAHDLDQAGDEYRMFLTDALGELAIARAHAGQYGKAAPNFDEALSFAPHSNVLQLEYAQAALQGGDLPHAKTLVQEVIREYPQNAKAHLILGQVLLKTNMNADARRELEQAVALDPTFASGYELAVACLNMEDEKCVTNIFSEMTASFGDTAVLHMYFGQAYLNSDFQNHAVAEFEAAVKRNPRLPGAHYSLAAAYLATGGDIKLAEAELRKEIAISPKEAVAYAALGHLEAGEHRYAEAEKELKQAAELDAGNPDTFLYLGQLYADMNRPAEAEAALRSSIRLTTDISHNHTQVQKTHYLLGRLLMQAGDTEEGQKELHASAALMKESLSRDRDRLSDYYAQNPDTDSGADAAAPVTAAKETQANREAAQQADSFEKQIGPAVADSYNNLGAIAGSERDFGAALTYFERAEEWNPELKGLDENWGRAAFAAGEFQQAVPRLRRYLRDHPEDKALRADLGISLYMVKDYAGARSSLQTIAAAAAPPPQVAYLYAECLVRTGDASEGARQLTALERRLPQSEEVHRALGEALASSGDPRGAAAELATAIRLNAKDAEAYDALGRLQLSQGNVTAAITNLEMAVKLAGQDGAAHFDLAAAYRQDGRPQDAAREMQRYQVLRDAGAAGAP